MSSESQTFAGKQDRESDEGCRKKNNKSPRGGVTNTVNSSSDAKMATRSSTLKSPKSRRQPPSSLLVTGASANSSNNYLAPNSYLSVETGTKSKNKSSQSLKKNKTPSPRNYSTIKKSKSKSESDAYNNSKTPSSQSLDSSSSKSRELVSDDVFETSFGITPTSQSTPSHSKNSGNDSRKTSRSKETPKTPRKSPKPFEQYLPLEEVQRGLKKGELIEGVLRINPKNFEDSYISAPDGQMDIYIGGILDRNRALNGDLVAVQLHPQYRWKILFDNVRDYESRFPSSFSNYEGLCSLTKGNRTKSSPQKQKLEGSSHTLSRDSPNISPAKTIRRPSRKKNSSCTDEDGKGCASPPKNDDASHCEDGENCPSLENQEVKKKSKKKKEN